LFGEKVSTAKEDRPILIGFSFNFLCIQVYFIFRASRLQELVLVWILQKIVHWKGWQFVRHHLLPQTLLLSLSEPSSDHQKVSAEGIFGNYENIGDEAEGNEADHKPTKVIGQLRVSCACLCKQEKDNPSQGDDHFVEGLLLHHPRVFKGLHSSNVH